MTRAGNRGITHDDFDNVPIRFLEVDFGECTDGRGMRVSSFGAFTRYHCPDTREVTRWLAALLDHQAVERKRFFAVDHAYLTIAVGDGKWRLNLDCAQRAVEGG